MHDIRRIREAFPDHRIVAEESGYHDGSSEYCWIVDALDGTSNFVARLPWFGAQVAVLKGSELVAAAMYLPDSRDLYWAGARIGAYRDGCRIWVSREESLEDVLCGFAFDGSGDAGQMRAVTGLLGRVAASVRSVRMTNCLVDFCCTADGRLGGCINLGSRVWDVAPACLILAEAGGRVTNLEGEPVVLSVDPASLDRRYAVVCGSPALHAGLLQLTQGFPAK